MCLFILQSWWILLKIDSEKSKSNHQWCSLRTSVLRNFAKPVPLQFYQKRDSGTGVFLWILPNFSEHIFYITPLDDCFWKRMFQRHTKAVWQFSKQAKDRLINPFWFVKVCLFWKFIQYSMHWDKTNIKEISSWQTKRCYKKCTTLSFTSSN